MNFIFFFKPMTKRTDEQLRNKFKLQISDDLRPLWNEALKEADEISALPIHLRVTALEKVLRRLLTGSKYKISPPGKKTIHLSLFKKKTIHNLS